MTTPLRSLRVIQFFVAAVVQLSVAEIVGAASGTYSLIPPNVIQEFSGSVSRTESVVLNLGKETYTATVRASSNGFGDLKAFANATGEKARAFSPAGESAVTIGFSETYQEVFYPTLAQRFPTRRMLRFALDYTLNASGPFFNRRSFASVSASVKDPFGVSENPSHSSDYDARLSDAVEVTTNGSSSKTNSVSFSIFSAPNMFRAPRAPEFDPTPYVVDYSWSMSLTAHAYSAAGSATAAIDKTLRFEAITLEDGITTPEMIGIFGVFVSGNMSPNRRLTVASIPGDYNGDGFVNLDDFNILKSNFGGNGGPDTGDSNGDGRVDLTDFSILKANFGRAAAVPEPSAMVLAALAVIIGLQSMRQASEMPVGRVLQL